MRARSIPLCLLPAILSCGAPAHAGGPPPAPHSRVTFVPAGAMVSDIAKTPVDREGIALRSYLHSPSHSVSLISRTRPGSAEVHRTIDDVWVVLEGEGTLVTGGMLVGAKETQPGEPRGERISGGTSRHIGKGDLVGIPAGVPHWLGALDGGRIVYLVVKVKSAAK